MFSRGYKLGGSNYKVSCTKRGSTMPANINGFVTSCLVIRVNVGNDDVQNGEDVARVLEKLAERFRIGGTPMKVMDINGNSVGDVDYC